MKWEGRDTWVMRLHDDGALDEGTEELWPSWKLDAHFEDAESTQSLVDLLNKMEKYKATLQEMAEEANNPGSKAPRLPDKVSLEKWGESNGVASEPHEPPGEVTLARLHRHFDHLTKVPLAPTGDGAADAKWFILRAQEALSD